MNLDRRFPTLTDLRRAAQRRLPVFLWDYLDGGAGNGAAQSRAEAALDAITLMPDLLGGPPQPNLSTTFLGQTFSRPFGMAPVGMSGGIWPDAEAILARVAATARIPYGLSTVAAATPEEIGPKAGGMGWFQLYAPQNPEMRRDILRRAREAGFGTLVFTVDVPLLSRRPRELRHGIQNPMPLTPRLVMQSAIKPAWAARAFGRPIPRPRLFDPYSDAAKAAGAGADKHIGLTLRVAPDWAYLDALRSEWDGPMIVKGVLDAATVPRLIEAGVDALWVSNHGGRQFEAAPAPLEVLPAIRAAAGDAVPLICDGAIRSGTDILRMMALGADFVMLGRAFHWGLAAAGREGAAQVVHILSEEMRIDMAQLAIDRPAEVRERLG